MLHICVCFYYLYDVTSIHLSVWVSVCGITHLSCQLILLCVNSVDIFGEGWGGHLDKELSVR